MKYDLLASDAFQDLYGATKLPQILDVEQGEERNGCNP